MTLLAQYRPRYKSVDPEDQTTATFFVSAPEPPTVSSKDLDAGKAQQLSRILSDSLSEFLWYRLLWYRLRREYALLNPDTVTTYNSLLYDSEGIMENTVRGTFSPKYQYKKLFTKDIEFRTAKLPRWKPRASIYKREHEDDD